MLTRPRTVQATSLPLRPRILHQQLRTLKALSSDVLQATSPVAERLKDTALWHSGSRGRSRARRDADKYRVNIVEEKLCDDILKYMGPTLQRHVGCDLIDLYPGAGVWSRKLHDVLQPRSHILMEPDAGFYRPFLEPLLAKSNTTIVPTSGIVWKELNATLRGLPHQVEVDIQRTEAKPQRNDTLLVTANLSTLPGRKFRHFNSISLMVMYQFLSSIRFGTLFQKYGLVRMLLWVPDRDKRPFLPQCVQNRKRSAVNAELSCEWLTEVVGKDIADTITQESSSSRKSFVRDTWIDRESGYATMRRMEEQGFVTPMGRETQLLKSLLERDHEAEQGQLAGDRPVLLDRRLRSQTWRELEAANASNKFEFGSKDYHRLHAFRSALRKDVANVQLHGELLAEMDAIATLRQQGIVDEALLEREQQWNDRIRGLLRTVSTDFRTIRDNLHLFRQNPPALLWDRRSMEPLVVKATEFFPNVECALLDIQPKAVHPLLSQVGPKSNRAGDLFELLAGTLMNNSVEPLSKALDKVWPGASDWTIPHCPSLTDRTKGGMPGEGYGELCSRILNEEQWMEILTAWMEWPFRPSYVEAVGRLGDDFEVVSEPVAD